VVSIDAVDSFRLLFNEFGVVLVLVAVLELEFFCGIMFVFTLVFEELFILLFLVLLLLLLLLLLLFVIFLFIGVVV
jgi:hypothetical protein